MLQARKYGRYHRMNTNRLTLSVLLIQSLSCRANYTDRLNKVRTGIIGRVYGANRMLYRLHQLTPLYRTL
jgi:hypothetical protein